MDTARRRSDLRAQAGGEARGGSVRARSRSLRDLERLSALQRPERASPPAAAADPDVRQSRAHPSPHRFTIRQIAWLSSAET